MSEFILRASFRCRFWRFAWVVNDVVVVGGCRRVIGRIWWIGREAYWTAYRHRQWERNGY